jgi:plastocyanin
MLASPLQSQKANRRNASVISPLRRTINTGNLAIVLFVALAVLSTIRGKEAETTKAGLAKSTKSEVVIDNFSFSPQTFTLPAGATITWTNRDNMPHTVTSADNRFSKSPVLKPGQSFSNTFAAAGTYSYFCSIHPRMTGKIIVK